MLIALDSYDCRLQRGVERFAWDHAWSLSADVAREKFVPWNWQGDGILAWVGAWGELAEFIEHQSKPTVEFSFHGGHLSFPRVLEDHAHAAQLVADHFLSQGFVRFAFYTDTPDWCYDERGCGFAASLQRAGRNSIWLNWRESRTFSTDRDQWKRRQSWLADQLKQAPKPLAVFAANDHLAVDALEACQTASLAVPGEIAIVGAGNYLLAPEAMPIPISSVDTNLELLGYRGAELLDQLMEGQPPPSEPIRIPAAGLVARKSSALARVGRARRRPAEAEEKLELELPAGVCG